MVHSLLLFSREGGPGKVSLQQSQVLPILLAVFIDSPHLHPIINNQRGPDHRIVRLLIRPERVTEDHDQIVLGLDALEGVPVPGNHLEELFPALEHDMLRPADVAFAIDERVIISHESGKTGQILIVDALVELESGEFGVSPVDRRHRSVRTSFYIHGRRLSVLSVVRRNPGEEPLKIKSGC